MEKAFATATEFDRALKCAVRESGGDPGAGYRQALRDRFLCRVFRGGNRDFVLKGGSGMLARIQYQVITSFSIYHITPTVLIE